MRVSWRTVREQNGVEKLHETNELGLAEQGGEEGEILT